MSLESRVVNWVDLGVLDYQRAWEVQEELVELRKGSIIGDTVLAFQSNPIVTFGNDLTNNRFSKKFLGTLSRDYTKEDISRELGKIGVDFFDEARSGGAAYLAPGQLVYFLVADHRKITGKSLDIADYKGRIYRTIFDALKSLGVEGIRTGSQRSYKTRKERRDVWIQNEGRSLKMGSKGIGIRENVAYHGFVLYLDKEGLDRSWVVNPCGYDESEAELISVEDYLGRKIAHSEVHSAVRGALEKNFGYEIFRDVSVGDLLDLNNEVLRLYNG